MNGSGRKNCPVNPCETTNYRGSTCAAQRAKFGLSDPQTNADRIRAMSDEELATFLNKIVVCEHLRVIDDGYCKKCPIHEAKPCDTEGILEWLKQPAE